MYWPLGPARIYSAEEPPPKQLDSTKENESQQEEEEERLETSGAVLGLQVTRNGNLFCTINEDTVAVWQTSPTVVLSTVKRSAQSMKSYGPNTAVSLRPDSNVALVQTTLGFLITYSIITDPNTRVYQQVRDDGSHKRHSSAELLFVEEERRGLAEVILRFRMVIKIDAGIAAFLAFDDELVVATEKPAAMQCIRWTPDGSGSQTNTELFARMPWLSRKSNIVDIIYDRAMNLMIWISKEGRAYAVQRIANAQKDADGQKKLFRGYGFHDPETDNEVATKAAINARFSLLALACANSEILVYTAKDYVGSIPLSHRLQAPASSLTTGKVTVLTHSPDGYCLFAGYEKGWALWSVYGKLLASSFLADTNMSNANDEKWLLGVKGASWLGSGSDIVIFCEDDDRLWVMEMAKSAVTGCFCAANIARTTLLTENAVMIYQGYDLPLSTTPSADSSLWHYAQVPSSYLSRQRPLRSAVVSSNGRYLAVAGRRGLAHYSLTSSRWRTFDDLRAENSFVVRGGMCWFQHVLIVAAEVDDYHELRMYSRDRALDDASLLYVEQLPASVVTMSLTGQDSLLVYTYRNILYHFVINASQSSVSLVQVGQIALNGIVRAPARVRSMSWILPEDQQMEGDPSQDVAFASVLFLVDAKLVLLQPSHTEDGGTKYDMRVIANNVEYFDLSRDQSPVRGTSSKSVPGTPRAEEALRAPKEDRGLSDSLWYFDGSKMHCWMDVEDLVASASTENDREVLQTVAVSADFYPTSVIHTRGIFLGIDADLIQRRDSHFAFFKFSIRSQLFLPFMLRRNLADFDPASAASLANVYQDLPYFSHALEMLLHTVLDDEVDSPPANPETALLPAVTSFLSSFPDYLDIVVQCTRKTELRSWKTLFAHVPPPHELFEASLEKGQLKTAGGYLLVLQTLEESEPLSEQCMRLLRKAQEAGDWDLCKELARFLMALDASGDTLRLAMGSLKISNGQAQGNGNTQTKAHDQKQVPGSADLLDLAGDEKPATNGDSNPAQS